MTDQPDLPPELIDPIANIIFRMRNDREVASTEIARAVAPMLIEHGRKLEKAEVVEWLLEDADKTEQEAARIVANTTGNPRKNAAEWKLLVSLKRGIATAIRARQTQEANHDF